VEVLGRHYCFNKAGINNWLPVIIQGLVSISTAFFYSYGPRNTGKPTKSSAVFAGLLLFQTINIFAVKFGCLENPNHFLPVTKKLLDQFPY